MDFIFEKETDKDFKTALADLKAAISAKSFSVMWEQSLKDKLQEKGQDFNTEFTVLEVCNPVKAAKVLNQKIEAGYMLPCKMAVYEKNGKVFLGMQNPLRLIEIMNESSLQDIAQEVADALSSAINAAV